MSDLRPAVQKLMVFNNHHINHMTNIGWCPFIILKYMVISKPPYPPKHNHQPSCVFMSHYSLQTYIRIIMVEHQRVDLCHTHPNLLRIKAITQSVNVILRAVKTGGPARFGPTHSGFGLHRAGLKSPDEKRARKSMARARPGTGFRASPHFFPFFFLHPMCVLKSKLETYYWAATPGSWSLPPLHKSLWTLQLYNYIILCKIEFNYFATHLESKYGQSESWMFINNTGNNILSKLLEQVASTDY